MIASLGCTTDDPPADASSEDASRRQDVSLDDASIPDVANPELDAGRVDAGASPRPYVHRDIQHIVSVGQSLSIGSSGYPALTTGPDYPDLMFVGGLRPRGMGLEGFVQLYETALDCDPCPPLIVDTNSCPVTCTASTPTVETISSGLAGYARWQAEMLYADEVSPRNTHRMLVSLAGARSLPFESLNAPSEWWDEALAQVDAAKSLADAAGESYGVSAITCIHGETDHAYHHSVRPNPYEDFLVEWQTGLERAFQERTGQSEGIPMLYSQMSSWHALGTQETPRMPIATSLIPQAQLDAALTNPDSLYLVGPKYMLDYVDEIHLTNHGYRQLGEYYGKVYTQVILRGESWQPLHPTALVRDGSSLVVRYHVPVPPLVLDLERIDDPSGRGFHIEPGNGQTLEDMPAVTAVTVVDADTVRIDLSSTPPAGALLGYAMRSYDGEMPRGLLRDSDEAPSRYGYELFNWAVHSLTPIL